MIDRSGTGLLALALAACACAGPTAPRPEPSTSPANGGVTAAAERLVHAAPADWSLVVPFVQSFGRDATTPLVAAIHAHPTGPGRQAAIATLGTLEDERAVPALIGWLTDAADEPTATEAALALGMLGRELAAPAAVEPLRRVAHDPSRTTRTRTAAACGLADLGHFDEVAPLFGIILLAGTPQGAAAARDHGFADDPRWAYERYVIIEAIRRHTGGETYGLDPDLSWPRLADATARFLAAHGAVDESESRE